MGKNVPKLRFRGFEGEWEEKKLGDIGEFKNGINKSKEDFGYGVPFINLMDVFGKTSIGESKYGLVNATNKEIKENNLIKGDVLFVRSSVKKEGVGQTVLIEEDLYNTVYSGFLIRFRENENIIYNDYKKFCFYTDKFRKKVIAKSSTSANTNINQESLKVLKIKLPSLQEQEKIANLLSKVDRYIELQEKKVSELEKYKKGMMQKIFSQKIRFRKDDGGEYPEWEVKKIGDILEVIDGDRGENYPSGSEFFDKGYCLFLNAKNVTANGFKFEETKFISKEKDYKLKKGRLERNDIVLTTRGTVGNVAIFNSNISYDNVRINSGMVLIRGNKVNSNYIYSYFRSQLFKKQIDKVVFGSAQPQLTVKEINKFAILIPSAEEQKKIADFLLKIELLIEKHNKKVDELKRWKKGLLQKMFV